MNEIRIYIEGGGSQKTTKQALRRGFSAFLGALRDAARERRKNWNIIVCGSRDDAFDDFKTAMRTHASAFNILLVDAEAPVTEANASWKHLRSRDGWRKPKGIGEVQCYLMVQAMEAWFLADPDTLALFYGQGFNRNCIPRADDVETIAKDTLSCLTRNWSFPSSRIRIPGWRMTHGQAA